MVAQVILYGAVRALLRTARGLLKLGSILFRAGLVGRVEVRYYSTGLTASSAARIAFAAAHVPLISINELKYSSRSRHRRLVP